jgi:hypothetical protein
MPTMDQAAHKPRPTSLSPPPPRQPYRRSRIIWTALLLFSIIFYFGAPWEFPAEGLSSISRASIAHLVKPGWVPDEIYGLLYFVTRADGRVLSHDPAIDPGKPMKLRVYEKANGNWTQRVQTLDEAYPVIVFSKVSLCNSSEKQQLTKFLPDILPVSDR